MSNRGASPASFVGGTYLGVESEEAQALSSLLSAGRGVSAPHGNLSGSGAPLDRIEQPSTRRIRPGRLGCLVVALPRGHSQPADVRWRHSPLGELVPVERDERGV